MQRRLGSRSVTSQQGLGLLQDRCVTALVLGPTRVTAGERQWASRWARPGPPGVSVVALLPAGAAPARLPASPVGSVSPQHPGRPHKPSLPALAAVCSVSRHLR